ncbi:hypothetical protein GCWU000322_00468 [Eubacterium saphenum ATCC 49989]|nr:hypothetical protein GCWU000322_00468 [Eubacterium saphenum ATCC 49989]
MEREKTSYFKKVAIKTGSEEENIKIDFPKFCNGFMTMTKVEENSKEGKKEKETY